MTNKQIIDLNELTLWAIIAMLIGGLIGFLVGYLVGSP